MYFYNSKSENYVGSLSIPIFVSFTHALLESEDDPTQQHKVQFCRCGIFQTINNYIKSGSSGTYYFIRARMS